MIVLKPWNECSDDAFLIRRQVFVIEQQVPLEMELDEWDELAFHALAFADESEVIMGTGRLVIEQNIDHDQVIELNQSYRVGRIGRLAILKKYRSRGYGSELLQALINKGLELGLKEFYLHAQINALNFYREFGFESEGDVFEEAGILHRTMRRLN